MTLGGQIVEQEQSPAMPSNATRRIGIIVIGRNEGERLHHALEAVLGRRHPVVYVDSGSTDGSADLARRLGATVHQLDPARPFSAARARGEGVEVLRQKDPSIDNIQFVDGDCVIENQWLDRAAAELDADPALAIVCGILREAAPERSVYNRLSALQWKAPTGEIQSCGGIFMVRADAYDKADGFNSALMTREERDFCLRVRSAGFRLRRIDAPMAEHDAGIERFSQWWARAVWGGYGDAMEIAAHGRSQLRRHAARIRRYLTWPVGLPLLIIAGLIASMWWIWAAAVPLACMAAYAGLFLRLAAYRRRQGDGTRDAITYAAFAILRKFANAQGFLLYFLHRGRSAKRPDPHKPHATPARTSTPATTPTIHATQSS